MTKRSDSVPTAEIITAALGALVVLATLVVLGREAIAGDPAPASIVITHDAPVHTSSGFLLPIHVRNVGGTTAGDVVIEGSVSTGGTDEKATITFDYVAPQSVRDGALLFTSDPVAHKLRLRAAGHTTP